MFGFEGTSLAFVATGAFALLLIILSTIAATTAFVNRYRPTVREAVLAEERLALLKQECDQKRDDLRRIEGRLTEVEKKESQVAWLEEKIDTLQREYEQLEPRKAELADHQNKLEIVIAKTGEAQRAFDEISHRLEAAKEADARINKLQSEIDVLDDRARDLRQEIVDLEQSRREAETLRADVARLRDEAERIEAEKSRLSTKVESLEIQLEGLKQAATEREEIRKQLEAARVGLAAARQETQALEDRRTGLVVEIAQLEDKVRDLRKEWGPGGGGEKRDALADLRNPPNVIAHLRRPARSYDNQADESEYAHLLRAKGAIEKAGLVFHDRTINAFHTALKVGPEAPITVLAGISGTGKTQLPRRYAESMGMGFLPMPVQPRWDSPQDLLGFYNFIEKRYKATELARAMYQMAGMGEDPEILGDRMLLVLLDEMNLARVEYYFSEFLSRLELRPGPHQAEDRQRRMASEIIIDVPGGGEERIFPGHNILFAGTMNEDESTQALSDKVLDRGNMLRFPSPKHLSEGQNTTQTEDPSTDPLSYKRWQGWRRPLSRIDRVDWAHDTIGKLGACMKDLRRPFGYRISQAMLAYVANYPHHDGRPGDNLEMAFADQVEMRLLPKLRGLEVEDNERGLHILVDLIEERLGDEALAEAVRDSIEHSRLNDRFVWSGLTR
ncbi:MAG: hypothetical protein KDE22_14910 [Rhodobacterales bacterium]|nr:hypothetical protein [Rhodobacterales bacterium]